jgi:hypothetical protein
MQSSESHENVKREGAPSGAPISFFLREGSG